MIIDYFNLLLSLTLFLQLARSKRVEENLSHLYELDGAEILGSYLRIKPCSDIAPELSKCSIQWYRISSEGGKKELISGKDMPLIVYSLF